MTREEIQAIIEETLSNDELISPGMAYDLADTIVEALEDAECLNLNDDEYELTSDD